MPTTVTKSIGTTGRDYSTIQAWEDACPANLVTSDQIWRGECYNDSEFTVAGTVLAFGGITTDATRYPELTAAAGQSFIDHAGVASNARKYDASLGVGLRATNNYGVAVDNGGGISYCRFSRLQFQGGLNANCVYQENSTDNDWNQCIFGGRGETRVGGSGTRIRNSLIIADRGSTILRPKYGADSYNNTVVWPSDVSNTGVTGIVSNDSGNIVQNTGVWGAATASSGTFDTTNSKNNATDLASIVGASGNQTSKTYANQFQNTTTAARDFRPKAGADTINTGTTDSTNAATDLIGTARPSGSSYDIGAEEYVSAGGAITLNADQGTITVTGYAATTRFSVAAAQGVVSVSGQAATTRLGMAAAQGTVAVAGQASTVAFLTAAAQGSVAVTGQAATVNWQMAGAQGSVAITGYDATFDLPATGNITLDADTGTVTIVGFDALMNWTVQAAQGSISVSGQASAVLWGLNANLGTLALVGYEATFDGVTEAPSGAGKPRKGKRRKVLVGERVFWSDQKAAIARAIAELQAERSQNKAEKAEKAAKPAQNPVSVEMNFVPLAGLSAADIQAMQADDDEDDIECLLMCS